MQEITMVAWVVLGLALTSLIIVARRTGTFLGDLVTIFVPAFEGVLIGSLLGFAVTRTDPSAQPGFLIAVGTLIGILVGFKRYFRQESIPRHPRGFWIVLALLCLPLIMDACRESLGPWFCGLQGC